MTLTLVLYFGINYSLYPDEGYGYGLVASIAFTVFGLFKLLWKYRDQEELWILSEKYDVIYSNPMDYSENILISTKGFMITTLGSFGSSQR